MNQNPDFNLLPRQQKDRQNLKKAILKYAKKLYDLGANDSGEKIDKLKLRLTLIDGCSDISLTRLGHLQEIFNHYCTHIYRTGKYMTFERLEYEKIHMNMDRFFLFLRDFELTTAEINGKETEVADKQAIVTIFKRTSSTSKSLNFEEFVSAIEKIGAMYFDEKECYTLKKQRIKQQKAKKKDDYERKRKRKLLKRSQIKAASQEKQSGSDKKQGEHSEGDQQSDEDEQSSQEQNDKKSSKPQNDKLIEDMMNDNDLQDPNEEVQKKIVGTIKEDQENSVRWDNQQDDVQKEIEEENPFLNLADDEILLALTKNEKVEFYYRKFGIDSTAEFRARLSQLNLPIYNHYSKSAKGQKRDLSEHSKKPEQNQANSIAQLEQKERIRALKEKMNQKKNKEKAAAIPKPRKGDPMAEKYQEDMKRRKELKKEREIKIKQGKQESDELLQKKNDQKKVVPKGSDKKKPDFDEKEISWNVMNLSIDQLHLNLKQFNPHKYFSNDDDDRIFLDQYMDRGRSNKAPTGLGIRERHSTSVVQGAKKRADEVEKTERTNQKKLNSLSKKIGLGQLVRQKF